MYIGAYNIPIRAVCFQYIAILFFIFDKRNVMKASHIKTEGLTSRASADFNTSEH